MPKPTPEWDMVPVFGKYVGSDGLPVSGRVKFKPRANRLVDAAALTTLIGREVVAKLDNTGSLVAQDGSTFQLPASDDPDITGHGFTYQVTEDFAGGATYDIEVPLSALSNTPPGIQLALLVPIGAADGGGSATNAAISAADAASSATAAATSETNAAASESAANSSAVAAAFSETNAAASASSAATSAANAGTSESNAASSASSAASSASAAATSEANASDFAGATQASAVSSDTVIASRTGDKTSATSTALGNAAKDQTHPLGGALSDSFAGKWKASTAYAAGDTVVAPDGSLVKAKAAFTSGTSYNATNWTSVAATPGTQAKTELDASIAQATNGLRPLPTKAIAKMRAGQPIKFSVFGDSVLAGSTATTPGTDDAMSLLASTLTSRFGVTVTKDNQSRDGRTAWWEYQDKWASLLAANADVYILGLTGKNDLAWEVSSGAAKYAGMKQSASLAFIESRVRELRARRPDVDIILASGNPYNQASTSSNTWQKSFSLGLARIAAHYGLPYADGWSAVKDPGGDYAAASDLTDGVHPNSSGHAKIAAAFTSLFPADPYAAQNSAASAALPERIFPKHATRIVNLTTASTTAHTDRIVTPGGAWTGTGPWTSSTAGDLIQVVAKSTDFGLLFTYGAGQGTVDIWVDGQVYASGVNLSTLSTGRWLTIPDLSPGVHNLRIVVVSGSVTLQQVSYNVAATEFIDITDARVTVTNPGVSNDVDPFYGKHSKRSSGTCVISLDFVGTGLDLQGYRSAGGAGNYWSSVVVDGVALSPTPTVPTGYGAAYGAIPIVTGLEYGKHSITLNFVGTDLFTGGFSVRDERPEMHPDVFSGIAKVGETVRLPLVFDEPPVVNVVSTTANAAGASTVTTSSFLVTGTAGDVVRWTARPAKRLLY